MTPEARITVLTGAGVSAASGVPTFRGADGLWKNFRPEALATAEAFGRDPSWCGNGTPGGALCIAACEPNEAHRVLADWSRRFPNFQLITQNVDGLHELRLRQGYGGQAAQPDVDSPARIDLGSQLLAGLREVAATLARRRRCSFKELPPRCPHCSGLDSPGVVWFGETLDPDRRSRRRRRPPSATSSSPSARRRSSIRRPGSSSRRGSTAPLRSRSTRSRRRRPRRSTWRCGRSGDDPARDR